MKTVRLIASELNSTELQRLMTLLAPVSKEFLVVVTSGPKDYQHNKQDKQ